MAATATHLTTLLEAYSRGYEKRYRGMADTPERKEHYFKVKEDLPRVQVVLSFLQGIVPAGLCQSLLDVGSGRGVFLFPLLREFPELEVTSLDILPHRVELMRCLHDGGVSNLHPLQEDICTWDASDKSFDVVTSSTEEILKSLATPTISLLTILNIYVRMQRGWDWMLTGYAVRRIPRGRWRVYILKWRKTERWLIE